MRQPKIPHEGKPGLLREHNKSEHKQNNISLLITTIPSEYKNIQSMNKYYTEKYQRFKLHLKTSQRKNNTKHN